MKKHPGNIIISPRITEKGAYMSESGVYVFNVALTANKKEIGEAITELFKVTPRSVRVAHIPRKQVVTRNTNRKGMTAGGKKAYVYLKKGDKIEIV
ncbi:50S ribosomal protein L23 [Candidatus Adlerbacteria bacterium RIFOXYC1_FULL_48_26]|uniref:Large ribosomal subunit protein uL23 n=1 Tax=Candidatus Adlerbacteria bacterium RIFOXYC1_FULL_48_26 TaxID=1797247 RepID=A0A1F4Y4I3_9BACT|nr:MAG: 50S ribosomal protein L23 [Candidatus Adlerbacteria bacterium RIFOXYC1_FULL_48_26]OGC93365.1 MAG: 50S ribosomal protein L23 [Candidatus Adlerbacteria bacterium RIFOXYB1_FULL_48_10]OGC96233.1 MAG: 50S ribosomal protein L23 [Candidatus Adlerbacteria bacterium RIFOXYD1_FULL_48_8]